MADKSKDREDVINKNGIEIQHLKSGKQSSIEVNWNDVNVH